MNKITPPDTHHPQSIKLTFKRDELVKMRGEDHCLVMPLPSPIKKDGEIWSFVVVPVAVTDDLQMKQNGQDILCRNEAEAHQIAKSLVEKIQRQLAEQPTPCDVLEIVEIIHGDEILVDIIPLTTLPEASGQSGAVEDASPDPDFLDIGHSHWAQPDGSFNAGLTTIREHSHFIEAYRLCRYHQPYPANNNLWCYGVERIRMKLDGTVSAVCYGKRWLYNTEIEAREMFTKCKAGIPQECDTLLNRPQKSAQARLEDHQLTEIQGLIDRAHDPVAKGAHLRRKQEILQARREGERAIVQNGPDVSEAENMRSREILFSELFPDFHALKARIKHCTPGDFPKWKEEMRRALAIDCRRLKIPSPFKHHFTIDDEFVRRLTAARSAKSPARAEDIEAVLNWASKGYDQMRSQAVAEAISVATGSKLNPVNFKRRRARKLRLFSKKTGRHETEPGQ
jgi:hypothetical protein